MSDDAFHEIQLNGKQLVFLFMAATVVSVVIFLCGVMVGRGVRSERGSEAVAENAAVGAAMPGPDTPPASSEAKPEALPRQVPAAEVPTPDEGPSDTGKAAAATTTPPPSSTPKASSEKPAAPAPAAAAKPEKPAARSETPAAAKAAPAANADAPGTIEQGGWAVQVAALGSRGDADAMVKRLVAKGYQAYVLAPGGKNTVFKVQVGRFRARLDAERIAARLKKEESFKPWVTR